MIFFFIPSFIYFSLHIFSLFLSCPAVFFFFFHFSSVRPLFAFLCHVIFCTFFLSFTFSFFSSFFFLLCRLFLWFFFQFLFHLSFHFVFLFGFFFLFCSSLCFGSPSPGSKSCWRWLTFSTKSINVAYRERRWWQHLCIRILSLSLSLSVSVSVSVSLSLVYHELIAKWLRERIRTARETLGCDTSSNLHQAEIHPQRVFLSLETDIGASAPHPSGKCPKRRDCSLLTTDSADWQLSPPLSLSDRLQRLKISVVINFSDANAIHVPFSLSFVYLKTQLDILFWNPPTNRADKGHYVTLTHPVTPPHTYLYIYLLNLCWQ